MTTQDGQVKWKIKDMRTHHMCGEIVALVVTPPRIMSICSYVMDKQ